MLNTTMLSINFFAEGINETSRFEFMTAVRHECASMNIQLLDSDIARLETRLNNIKNSDKSEDEKKVLSADLEQQIADKKSARVEYEQEQVTTLELYDKVVTAMSKKNENGFGNHKDVVRTVLRVLASWDNSKLMKYAIIPAFQSPALYEALLLCPRKSRMHTRVRLLNWNLSSKTLSVCLSILSIPVRPVSK